MRNKQNCYYRALENPRELNKGQMNSSNKTVWFAVRNIAVLGHYFLDTVIANSERYIEMIDNYILASLRRKRKIISRVWLQQDDVTARTSMSICRSVIGDHLISRFAHIPCSTRSFELSTCGYFLGETSRYVRMYINPVHLSITKKVLA